MTIVVGCDNAAVELKNTLIACLKEQGVTVEDEGCMDASDPTVYPLVAKRVCENIIRSGYAKRGVLVCGTGIGMCITANKFPGIRAAVGHDCFSAERSILSNNGQCPLLRRPGHRAGAGQEDPQGVDHPGVSGRLLHPQGTGHSRHRAREHEVSG